MRNKEKVVEVYRAAGEMEAQVIRGLLESFGIPSVMKSRAAPSVHAFAVDGMGEVRIMVLESMAEKAKILVQGEDDAQVAGQPG